MDTRTGNLYRSIDEGVKDGARREDMMKLTKREYEMMRRTKPEKRTRTLEQMRADEKKLRRDVEKAVGKKKPGLRKNRRRNQRKKSAQPALRKDT